MKFNRGAEDQTLWSGNCVDRAVIEPVDPWNGRSVIEAHYELSMKRHTAGPTDHDPDQIGAVGRWHEIDDRRTARHRLKFGLEHQRARTITPTYIENRMFRCNEPSSIFSSSEQAGEARSRVETGPAQPVD